MRALLVVKREKERIADRLKGEKRFYPRPFVGEGGRRTGEGSHSDKIAQQVRDDRYLIPTGRRVKTKGRNGIPPRLILFTQKVPVVRKEHQSPKHTAR